MRTQGTKYFRGTERRTEGRKAENYVPPLFFEKAGNNKGVQAGLNNTGVLALCEWSDRINRLVPTRIFPVFDHDAEYICRSFGIIERKFVGVAFSDYKIRLYKSCVMRKSMFPYAKTKVQISYRAANQRLCFRYIDNACTLPLLPTSEISCLYTSSVLVHPP